MLEWCICAKAQTYKYDPQRCDLSFTEKGLTGLTHATVLAEEAKSHGRDGTRYI